MSLPLVILCCRRDGACRGISLSVPSVPAAIGKRYTGPGRWIDIGQERKLYVVEKGSGGPAVLFEAGIAATNAQLASHSGERFSFHLARHPMIAAASAGAVHAARRARPSNIATELAHDAAIGRHQTALHPGRAFLRRLGDAPLCSHLSRGRRRRRADRSDALRGVAATQSRQAIHDRSRQETLPVRDSDCTLWAGPTSCDISALPFGAPLGASGRRHRQRRPPCAATRHRRSGQDAQRSLARRRRALVAAGILRRDAKPRRSRP